MISLLLTLFISLFSVGSSVFTLEDHQENNIIIYDSKPISNLYTNVQYGYVGFSEVGSYSFFEYFINEIKNSEYIYNSGVTYDDFVSGTYIYCNLTNKDIVFGNIDSYSGLFTVQDSITAFRCDLDRSPAYRDTISYRFYYGNGGSYRSVETNIFYQDTEKTMPCSCSATYYVGDNSPTYYENLCFRYSISDFRGLFPKNFVDIEYNLNYSDGYNNGYTVGYNNGYSSGDSDGYQRGYTTATNDFNNYDDTAVTIFEGIFNVGLLPVNVFLTIFNFELFGVNIAGILSGLLTLSVVIIIIRFLLGGKKDD